MRNSTKLIILTAFAAVFCGLYLFQGLNGSFDYALPRRGIKVMAMAITGVAIAYSTVIFQTITHNRILTPSIMGLDSLYLLLQTVVIFFLGSSHVTIVNKHVNFILSVADDGRICAYPLPVFIPRRETADLLLIACRNHRWNIFRKYFDILTSAH